MANCAAFLGTALLLASALLRVGGLAHAENAPAIASLLKPEVLKKVLQDREVATSARLADLRYAYSVAFLVHSDLARTVRLLTDYEAYPKLVPYIDQAIYDQTSHILKLRGSIWKFYVLTEIRFQPKSDRWIGFEMVYGHFKGMHGEMIFEDLGEKGTLVCVRGEQSAREFPPKFILEQGAPIVFGVTGRRMRSYVETSHSEGAANDPQVPRPRRRIESPGR